MKNNTLSGDVIDLQSLLETPDGKKKAELALNYRRALVPRRGGLGGQRVVLGLAFAGFYALQKFPTSDGETGPTRRIPSLERPRAPSHRGLGAFARFYAISFPLFLASLRDSRLIQALFRMHAALVSSIDELFLKSDESGIGCANRASAVGPFIDSSLIALSHRNRRPPCETSKTAPHPCRTRMGVGSFKEGRTGGGRHGRRFLGARRRQDGPHRTAGMSAGSGGSQVLQDHKHKITAPAMNSLPNLYPNWNAVNFSQIRNDENVHVEFLGRCVGSYARPVPTFQGLEMPDVLTFAKTSFALENTEPRRTSARHPLISSPGLLVCRGSNPLHRSATLGLSRRPVRLNARPLREQPGIGPPDLTPLDQRRPLHREPQRWAAIDV